MPKIVLTNTETGEDEEFEPVDAREILRMEGTVYQPSEEGNKNIGVEFTSPGVPAAPRDPPAEGVVGYWQLQGADNELETGVSTDKYRRDQVVLAVPSSPELAARTGARAQTATAREGETFVRREDAERADAAAAEAAQRGQEPVAATAERRPAAVSGESKTARATRRSAKK